MRTANSVGDVEKRRRQLLESVPVAFLLTDVHSRSSMQISRPSIFSDTIDLNWLEKGSGFSSLKRI